MSATYYIDKIMDYYQVSTITELSKILGIGQPAITKWKKNNSITPIKKKCRELQIYNEIFGDIQNIGSISGGQVAQHVHGNQVHNSDYNELQLDEEIEKVLKSAWPIIEDSNEKKEDFIKHIKKWIVENL